MFCNAKKKYATKKQFSALLFSAVFLMSGITAVVAQSGNNPADYANPFIGVLDDDSNCTIGPQLPFGSVNPRPQTPGGKHDGYAPDQPVRGFGQLHVSGTGWGKCDAMSSWYVFAALGFFPNAGQPFYYLNGSTFPKITMQLGNGKKLVIKNTAAQEGEKITLQCILNGKKLDNSILTHAALMEGGVLEFKTEQATTQLTK